MKLRIFTLLAILFFTLATVAGAASPLVRCSPTLDRGVLPAGAETTVVIKVSLDVPPAPRETARPPVSLALVLDRSGSMAGDKLEKAKEAAIQALRRLDRRDLFSLVIYDQDVETLVPPQSAANSEWIEARIRGIQSGGNTALFGAVSQGAAELRKSLGRGFVPRLILLSDGLANVGPSTPDDLARLGGALFKEGIAVTTIGVGNDYNEDLMSRLAAQSDGNHYFVESERDLPRIFAAELGDVLSVVARKVVIEIDCPPGVRPLRVIGRDGRISGNRVELQMNQLYGGQQKYALLEVAVPAAKSGASRELAQVHCSYENALTSRPERSESTVKVTFSGRTEEVRQATNQAVQRVVVENEMAVARDKALDLYNAGQPAPAAALLRQSSQELKAKSEAAGLSSLANEADSMSKDAAQFEEQQLSAPEKKSLRSESYKVRNQQKN
jgi:Ca-activated chloride channel homolog